MQFWLDESITMEMYFSSWTTSTSRVTANALRLLRQKFYLLCKELFITAEVQSIYLKF
jgi:hypothetical protein